MKVLSLFDGISCLRVALGDRPVEYYASEIEPNAIKISKKNYPDIKHIGNVCDISGYSGIDLLVGGSPCTDLSIAKKERKGLDGDHSKLFWEFVRVLKDTKPKYFILENVASMPKKDRDIITKELGVEPILINASLVSAQSRKRLFWTNIPDVKQPEDKGIMLKDILQPDVEFKPQKGTLTPIQKDPHEFHQLGYFGDKNASNVGGQGLRVYSVDAKATTSGVGLYAVNKPMTETPNAKSKGGLKKVGFVEKNLQGYRVYSTEGKATTLSSSGGGLGQSTGLYLIKGVSVRGRLKGQTYENKLEVRKDDKVSALTSTCSSKLALVGRMVNRRLDDDGKRHDGDHAVPQTKVFEPRTDDKSGTLTNFTKDNMVLDKDSIRRLTPVECERLMGLPDNYTDGVANSARYRAIGNAFSVPVMRHILSFIK